jgi:uncharacterized membrane protein
VDVSIVESLAATRFQKAGFAAAIRSFGHWIVPLCLAMAYTIYFCLLAIKQRTALYHFDEDLAIYDQIVWNTSRGRLFASTLIQHADNMLGDHFSPVVALFAPLYWIWSSANVLLVGQTVALALAALPLYAFARRELGTVAAAMVVGAYLVYPALHFVNLFQFHEITLLALPLSVALLAVEFERRRLFLGATLVALTVKEEVAIVVVALGLLWWLRRRDFRMGLLTIALGVVVGGITMGLLLPALNTASESYYYTRRYAYLGNSLPEIAFTALTSPDVIARQLATTDRATFLAQLLGPLALTPIAGWPYLVAALPIFGYLLLSESPDQFAINRHYLVPLLPFLFFGSVLGLRQVERVLGASLRRLRGNGPVAATSPPIRMSGMLAGLMLLTSATASYLIGPTPLARGYDPRADTTTTRTHQVRQLVDQIPSTASVSASRNLLSWFSQRERVYRYPELSGADYILIDWRDLRHPVAFQVDDGAFGRLMSSSEYRLADAGAGAVLLIRGDPSAWADQDLAPTQFGDEVELLGYRVRSLPPGSNVEVTLYWRAIGHPRVPYTVFVHLFDSTGERVGQHDSWPIDGLYPTDLWQPGRVVADPHILTPRHPLSEGRFRLQVGLYDARDGTRLPITARGLPGGRDFVEIRDFDNR